MSRRTLELTPELMLAAYRHGIFPMAERRDSDALYWMDPPVRGILPLDGFHLPRRLARTVLVGHFELRADNDFPAVIAACAQPRPGKEGGEGGTWINRRIEELFTTLHRQGHAHCIETWQDGALVGGLYGVAIGGAFFGESMFSRVRDASKVALADLVARLRLGGFSLLDSQYVTPHLAQFGAIEIPRAHYRALLGAAVSHHAHWPDAPEPEAWRTQVRAMGRT